MSHTPRPWMIREEGPDFFTVFGMDERGKQIYVATVMNPEDTCLIAYAPTMLRVLENFVQDHDSGLELVIDRLRAAVRMAKGTIK